VDPRRRGRDAQRGQPDLPVDPRERDFLADAARRTRLGAIELVAVLVVILALVALAVWFFFFARNPLLRP
jgi:hypothetical protein